MAQCDKQVSRRNARRNPAAERVFQRVCSRFEAKTQHHRHVLRDWEKGWPKAAKGAPDGQIITELSADQSIEAVVCQQLALLAVKAAHRQSNVAVERYKLAKKAMLIAVKEFEDVDPDGTWVIDPYRLLVLEDDTAIDSHHQQLVAACRWLASEATDEQLQEVSHGKVKQHKSVRDAAELTDPEFFMDLADFLLEQEANSRALVRDLLNDKAVAQRIIADHNSPKVLVFLAKLVIKCSGVAS